MHMVLIKQAGGKYGSFQCPLCNGNARWKFSQSAGMCNQCCRMFAITDGEQFRMDAIKHGDRLVQIDEV